MAVLRIAILSSCPAILNFYSQAAPEDISVSHAKRIASETMTFHFSLASQSRRSNGHLLIGKVLWQSQAAHKWHRSALLAHPEISNEKIWSRKIEKLFDHQQVSKGCEDTAHPSGLSVFF
jgi:hypothetical protein